MITARDRRTLAIGAGAIGCLLTIARGLPAWRSWLSDGRAAAAEQIRAAQEADALVSEAGAMRDTLAARNARYVALAPMLVSGDTPAEASASLASVMSSAASGAGVKLGTVQLRPAADTGARRTFVRVGVRADVVGDIAGIAALLASLERGPIRLRVQDVTVTQPDAASPRDRVEALHAEITIEGLALNHGGRVP
jgi:threonine dehydrogenase-like Zn-dependent dehydrogenase